MPPLTPQPDVSRFDLRLLMLHRQRLVSGVILGLVGIGMVLTTGIPTAVVAWESWEGAQKEEQTMGSLRVKLTQLQSLGEVPGYDSRDKVDLLLPNQKPLVPLLNAVAVAAQGANVSVSSLKLTPGRISTRSAELTQPDIGGNDAKGSLTINFETQGSLPAIYDLMKRLESTAPFTTVSQLSLSKVRSVPGANTSLDGSAGTVDQFRAGLRVTGSFFTDPISLSVDTPLPQIGAAQRAFLEQVPSYTYPDPNAAQTLPGGNEALFDAGITPQSTPSPLAPLTSPAPVTGNQALQPTLPPISGGAVTPAPTPLSVITPSPAPL